MKRYRITLGKGQNHLTIEINADGSNIAIVNGIIPVGSLAELQVFINVVRGAIGVASGTVNVAGEESIMIDVIP